jgi:hypothetical protein
VFDINEILRAQACDNLPREVCHDTQLANRTSDQSESGCQALPVDKADAGGDQADAVQSVGRCILCGDPVEDGHAIHRECIPF